MIWTLTLINVSGATINLYSPTISLHDPTSAKDFSPDSMTDSAGAPYDPDLDANANVDCSVIFTFLPYTQIAYALNVESQAYDGNNIDVKFDPLEVTF